jgi:hypothetical protein
LSSNVGSDVIDFFIPFYLSSNFWTNLDLRIFIKFKHGYSFLFWINVIISSLFRRTWWFFNIIVLI